MCVAAPLQILAPFFLCVLASSTRLLLLLSLARISAPVHSMAAAASSSSNSSAAPAGMIFHPYQKIAQATSGYALSKKDDKSLFGPSTKWVVTEKIHGANFSVYHCPATGETRFAKRTGFLQDCEWFYNFQDVADELAAKVAVLASHAKMEKGGYIIVYGELFGGFYPPAAEAAGWSGAEKAGRLNSKQECVVPLEARAIQEGIYYSDKVEFVVFDIAVVPAAAGASPTFLSFDQMQSLAKSADVLCMVPLLIGSLQECLKFPFVFDSSFATTQLKQQPLPKGSNMAEGVVLKPAETYLVAESGAKAAAAPSVRCMLKLKNPAFAEISGDFTAPSATAGQRLSCLVNPARLAALQSKHGRITRANADDLVAKLMDDCWEDFYALFPGTAVTDWEADNAALERKCRAIIDKNVQPE